MKEIMDKGKNISNESNVNSPLGARGYSCAPSGARGRRFGQTILLKPEGVDEYVKHHASVWPGVLEMIKQCNIQNYSIYKKDLMLFAYFEYVGNDFEADMAKMAADIQTQHWWDVVKPLMQPIENRKAGEFWADMEEIFHI